VAFLHWQGEITYRVESGMAEAIVEPYCQKG
jgi:hypothetical protein